MKPQKITIEAPARIHVSLIALDAEGYRVNGGAGFAVTSPSLVVECSWSETLTITDLRSLPLEPIELIQLRACILSLADDDINTDIVISISGSTRSHSGFGSGTATRLACIEAVCLLNGQTISHDETIRRSGRGGTSGVGITTYFSGGFSLDIGRNCQERSFAPSDAFSLVSSVPLRIVQAAVPRWNCGIYIPDLSPIGLQAERQLFNNICPLPIETTKSILYEIVMGLFPAIIEHDYSTFCSVLKALQNIGFKSAERQMYGQPLKEIEHMLYNAGADAVAMSSLGPALIVFGSDIARIRKEISPTFRNTMFFETSMSNNGRTIIYG